MFLATLGASLLGSMLVGKTVIGANKETIRATFSKSYI